MLKVLAFLTKREGLETQELIDYYGTGHVPLVLTLVSATPVVYKRNYLVRGDSSIAKTKQSTSTSSPSSCSRTERGSSSGSRNSRWRRSQRTKNGSSIDRGTGAYVIEERVTAG